MDEERNTKAITRFGEEIKTLRQKQGVSQEQLAFEAGIPRNQVGRIERGEINTSISTVFALAKALHVHPKTLFDFDFVWEE